MGYRVDYEYRKCPSEVDTNKLNHPFVFGIAVMVNLNISVCRDIIGG